MPGEKLGEMDKNLRKQAKRDAAKDESEGKNYSYEDLLRMADDHDAHKKEFAQLGDETQLERAQEAGCASVDEYIRKMQLRPSDPSIYRVRAQLMKSKK